MAIKTGKKRIRNRVQVQTALDLRYGGASFNGIGKAMNISKTRAYQLVTDALAEIDEELKDTAARARLIELGRLDSVVLAHWNSRANPRNAEILLKAGERRARLLGLDAPAKIAQTTPDGDGLPPALDLSKLTDEQLAALDAIYAAAAPQPTTTLEEV